MWHRRKRRRLGVTTKHRKALLRNLVRGLVFHRQIKTTLSRAKEASRLADKMVTLAKEGTLAARRQIIRHLGSPEVAKELMEHIAPSLRNRQGGYTRVLKLGCRNGDGAAQALLQFSVPIEVASEKKPKKEKKIKPPEAQPKEKEEKKPSKEKVEKPEGKAEDTEKRGSFLSKLRKFLKGE